jgi:sec-independent protein translocase protein TatA
MGFDNPFHILILVLVILLVFGARRLPEIGRSLGSGMREFKDAVTGDSKPPALTAAAAPPAQPQPFAQREEAVAVPAPPAQPVPAPVAAPPAQAIPASVAAAPPEAPAEP